MKKSGHGKNPQWTWAGIWTHLIQNRLQFSRNGSKDEVSIILNKINQIFTWNWQRFSNPYFKERIYMNQS